MATTQKRPAATFKRGTVKAAIWENTGKGGTFYTVTFTRPFKSAEGKWKNSTSYSVSDLHNLSTVTYSAQLWIMKNKT